MSQRPTPPYDYGYGPPPPRKPLYPNWLVVAGTLTVFGVLFGGCIGVMAALGTSTTTTTTQAPVALAPTITEPTTTAPTIATAPSTTAASTTTQAPAATRRPTTTKAPTTTRPKPKPRPQPEPEPEPDPAPAPFAGSVGDKDCKDFDSQAEAQAYFDANGGSPSNNFDDLDRDHDGIACEALP